MALSRHSRSGLSITGLLILLSSTTLYNIHAFVAPTHHCIRQKHPPNNLSRPSSLLCAHHYKYLATCLPGLAGVVEQEIIDTIQGAYNVETSGTAAVQFEGDSVKVGLQALLHTRATHKVMEFLGSGDNICSRQDVYDFVQQHVNVKQLLGDGKGGLLTISVHVVLTNARDIPSDINHSHYTALTIKNALVDAVRELKSGERPCVDIESADVPLVAVVRGAGDDTCISLYRQFHNGSLHKRGYRSFSSMHKASMKESMAAGLLLGTEYDFENANKLTLVDPMAGSGSLLLEACMILGNVAPGLMRIKCGVPGSNLPPVLKWKNDEEDTAKLWKEVLLDATQRAKSGLSRLRSSPSIKIVANEIHPGALDLLEESLHQAGFSDIVEIHQGDCQDFIVPNTDKCLVVTNPPWGVRLTQDMHESWEALRVFLRENSPPGTEAWVLSGNKEATKHLGLRRSQSMVLQTGQQDLRWIQYNILDKSERIKDDEIEKHRHPREEEQKQPREETTKPRETPSRTRYTPSQSARKSNGEKSTRGGYERRNNASRRMSDKSVTKPLSTAEREERKNSWYI